MVDQSAKLVEKARETLKEKQNMRHYWVKGLQEFEFGEKYNCIWVQWVFSQLSDEDAVKFLLRAKDALLEGGVIILKENHCSKGFVVDKEDFSVTRSTPLFKSLFQKAGVDVVMEETQENWPNDLFGVRMYALA
jgi:protein N-terminal methyltransferase